MTLALHFSEMKKQVFSNLQMEERKSLQETDHEKVCKSDRDHLKDQVDVRVGHSIPLVLGA